MAVYRRGNTWWYEFYFDGRRVRDSSKQTNKRVAEQMEAAAKTQLAKGEVGIQERKKAPILAEFAPKFESAIETLCADKPDTIGFYKEKLRRLVADKALASLRLDAIDEAVIDGYKQRRTRQQSRYKRPLSPASVNRELATLRRLLRLAQEWKMLNRVPRIRMLRGERNRDYILSHQLQPRYLEATTQPLKDVAVLILETGVRQGEAANLQWPDVHLNPAVHAKFGYISIRKGKSRNAPRNLSLTATAAEMLKTRKAVAESRWVFPGEVPDAPILGTSLDHMHDDVRTDLKLPADFVIHSLRHTMLTRLGEAGADAFTIMRIAGHASVTTSQRYVHPTPEGLERAFERLEDLNARKFEEAVVEAAAGSRVPTNLPTVRKSRIRKSAQVVEITNTGP